MNVRVCLKCQEQLRGRADQKFCSDQCRSAFNNQQYIESNNVIRTINRILKKNHFILSCLIADGKTTVPRGELLKKGYRFDYFTCTCTSRSHKTNYFVYDLGFREGDNEKLLLLQHNLNKEMAETKPSVAGL